MDKTMRDAAPEASVEQPSLKGSVSLGDLLARVEAATGASIHLDDAASRVDPTYSGMRIHPYIGGTLIDDANCGRIHDTPRYTASLDAALALVERAGASRPRMSVWVILNRAMTDVSAKHHGQVGHQIAVQEIVLAVLARLLRSLAEIEGGGE